MRLELIVFFVFCLLFVTSYTTTTAASGITDPRWAEFDKAVQQRLEFFDVPGAAVAVVENGRLVLLKCYGERDIARHLPVTENANFQLASVSKFIFALAAAKLQDEQLLNLDSPVIKYLPSLQLANSYVREHVTMIDLLSHRSELKRFDGDDLLCFGYSSQEIMARAQYFQIAGFRDKARYSNAGYLIAGAVVSAATGRDWKQDVAEKLFAPLGMTGSYCESTGADFLAAHNDYALPYTFDFSTKSAAPYRQRTDYGALGPAGAMSSNITDMSKLLLMLTNNGCINGTTVLSAAALEETYAARVTNNAGGPERHAHGFNGLGCNGYLFNNTTIIEKDGLLNGYAPVICLVPSKQSGIVVLCNSDMIDFHCCVRELFLEYILGKPPADLQKSYLDSWSEERNQSSEDEEPAPVINPPPSLKLQDYCGVYSNPCYGAFTVALQDNRLAVTAQHNQSRGWLVPQGGDNFLWYWPENQDEFAMRFIITGGKVSAASGEWLGHLQKE